MKEPEDRQGAERIMPYDASGGKGEQVGQVFDSIAPSYDIMNACMSLGMHTHWRNLALRLACRRLGKTPESVLDVATGTGDVVFAMRRRWPGSALTGIDLSAGMLDIARRKLADYPEEKLISVIQGDCMEMRRPSDSFDLVTVA